MKDDAKEPFRTPEEVAADDAVEDVAVSDNKNEGAVAKMKWHKRFDLHWPPGKREFLAAGAVILVLLFFGWVFGLLGNGGHSLISLKSKHNEIRPRTVASKLTGLQVDPKVNDRPVTAVMIENSIFARPQSGLSEAGVVFEAIAEGGITRFMALYQDTEPKNIGPVRSSRPYYLQWEMAFDAPYAHVGGSPEALSDIRHWHVKDLDEFFNAGAYHRISSREAPHNVYTSLGALRQLEKSKGFNHSDYTGFARTKPPRYTKSHPQKISAKNIDLTLSGYLYNVHYEYNPRTNSYNRFQGGDRHIEANTNKQISPNVVIGLVVPYGLEADGHHSDYKVLGHGRAYIFQNGQVQIATWYKKDSKTQITFTDDKGNTVGLIPGQTWITAISDNSKVRYSP